MTNKYIVFVFFIISFITFGCSNTLWAQADSSVIPFDHIYFHKQIEKSRAAIWALDGKADSSFIPGRDTLLNNRLNQQLLNGIDEKRFYIERTSLANSNQKVRLLRGIQEIFQFFYKGYTSNECKAVALADALSLFDTALELYLNGESIAPAFDNYSYESSNIVIRSVAFADNKGYDSESDHIHYKYCLQYPEKTMYVLNGHIDLPYADTLMALASRKAPETVFDYAASSLPVVGLLRNSKDPMTQTIVKMASMRDGQQYFPFLDNLNKGRISFDDVALALEDSTKYYSLLVKTAIDYADDLRKKDTAATLTTLRAKLAQKAKEIYVNVINDLHEEQDPVRFKKIDKLTPEELYYLAVTTEEDIYTSSFVRGVYPRVWKNMLKQDIGGGDSLMLLMRFDYFKKWVKMCANYNTLSNFLQRMEPNNAQLLMKAFVNGLDKTNSLEDAVDVADAFGSINDKSIRNLLLNQLRNNLQLARTSGSLRSMDIYNILEKLFMASSDTSIDVSKSLGISNIYRSTNKELQNEAGRIIIQQFFYGDKDGMGIYNRFINTYSGSANWSVVSTPQWAEIRSKTGVPISIFCNRALDEEKNLDAYAQEALCSYLDSTEQYPSFVIHRGHSYFLPYTLDQLFSTARVIYLGSCGAYQNLDKVLTTCPEAQIVSSKQTGSGSVNFPMIIYMAEALRQGKDLDWPDIWRHFSSVFAGNEYFPDYVPPYKNLGALFLMAYNKLQVPEAINGGAVN